ncbi:MAG: carbohydrate kinase [Mycobacteriaceae bacterium]
MSAQVFAADPPAPARVVVGGEALVDLVPVSHTPLALLAPCLGGGPFNVAVTLGRLGVPTAFCSRVSTDGFGAAIVDHLTIAGVDTSLVERGVEPSTIAVVSLGEHGSASYSFYVDGTADRLVADPGPLPGHVAAVSLGTLGMLLEPGASVYEEVLHREHAAGRLTVLDPNIRPALIADPQSYRARFASWLPSVDILKLSDDDADWLQGSPEQWLHEGVSAVVLTRGAQGLRVHTTDRRVDVPGARVRVADTIGAGDTVHGALLAWLDTTGALDRASVRAMDAETWRRALGFVAQAAGITVSRPGADPPWKAELQEELQHELQ